MYPLVAMTILLTVSCDLARSRELVYTVTEEGRVGHVIVNMASAVADTYSDEVVTFAFLMPPRMNFSLSAATGLLTVSGRINRDDDVCAGKMSCVDSFRVTVSARDRVLEVIKVTIQVTDLNDNAPMFPEPQFTREALEGAGVIVTIPLAVDPDSPPFAIDRYEIETLDGVEFRVEVRLTELHLIATEPLDRELVTVHRMRVYSYDGGTPSGSGTTVVTVMVTDANDNAPVFTRPAYTTSVSEDLGLRSTVLRVTASDADAGDNRQLTYSLTPTDTPFDIDPVTGDIVVVAVIDFERSEVHQLSVTAVDSGTPPLSAVASVLIRVRDVNDHAPVIAVLTPAGVATVPEDASVGTFVAHVTVTDADSGRNADCTCSTSAADFRLRPSYDMEYQLVSARPLDHETTARYSIPVTCVDGGEPRRETVKHISVNVTDVNDNEPVFTAASYTASVLENNVVGASVLTVSATDADSAGSGAGVRYHVSPDAASVFAVDPDSGVVTARVALDHETMDRLHFYVVAVDDGVPPLTSSALVVIVIEDTDDERPVFSSAVYVFNVTENLPPGRSVGRVVATDADQFPYNEFRFLLATDDGFTVDAASGVVTTTRRLDREQQAQHTLLVTVTDFHQPPRVATATVIIGVLDVNDNRPRFVFPSDKNDTVSVSNRIPIGYEVARPHALDLDSGINGQLTYRLASGNRQRLFSIDTTSGAISLNAYISDIRYRQYRLQIEAADGGDPQWTASAELTVVIDEKIAFVAPASVFGGRNFAVAVSLAVVSAIIAVILVTAIVTISRRRRKPVAPPGGNGKKRSDQVPYEVDVSVFGDKQRQASEHQYTQVCSIHIGCITKLIKTFLNFRMCFDFSYYSSKESVKLHKVTG